METTTEKTAKRVSMAGKAETKKTVRSSSSLLSMTKLPHLPALPPRNIQCAFRCTRAEYEQMLGAAAKGKHGVMSDYYRFKCGLELAK